MNNLVRHFRLGCPHRVEVYGLHRKGLDRVDLHGSDIAIAVSKGSFRKLAVFQIKRTVGSRAKLERRQLEDALKSGLPPASLFVLSADTISYDFRVKHVAAARHAWKRRKGRLQITQTFRVDDWASIREFASAWLQCKVGAISASEFESARGLIQEHLVSTRPLRRNRDRLWLPNVLVNIALPSEDNDFEWA